MLHASVVDHLFGDPSLSREVKVDVDQEEEDDGNVKRRQTFPT